MSILLFKYLKGFEALFFASHLPQKSWFLVRFFIPGIILFFIYLKEFFLPCLSSQKDPKQHIFPLMGGSKVSWVQDNAHEQAFVEEAKVSTVVQALVSSRLDCCCVIFEGLPLGLAQML